MTVFYLFIQFPETKSLAIAFNLLWRENRMMRLTESMKVVPRNRLTIREQ